MPQEVEIYCTMIKQKYKSNPIQPECWPNSSISDSLKQQYIKLALVLYERKISAHNLESVRAQQKDYVHGNLDQIIAASKKEITLKEIFDPLLGEDGFESPLKILLDGAPGIGKTTLTRKACYEWASDQLLSQYYLVLLLSLRDTHVFKVTSIDTLFNHEDNDIQQETIRYIKRTNGKGVLLIFEGFDELSIEERNENSFILKVVKGEILSECSVLVTSRPYASEPIHRLRSVNRHIQVIGFRKEQVRVCIRQVIEDQDKAEELCTLLDERYDLASLCYSPLNCAIILFVYQANNYHLPKTMTELYELLIIHLFKRYGEANKYGEWKSINSLEKLPCNSDFCLKCIFRELCHLAYNGLRGDQLVFDEQDIKAMFTKISGNCASHRRELLNLMSTAKCFTLTGTSITYNFVHLTIQEFLAALWITKYKRPDQFFKDYFHDDRFRLVILFVSGLSKLQFRSALPTIKHYLRQMRQESCKKDEAQMEVFHLLYESDEPTVIASQDLATDMYFQNKGYTMSPRASAFDCLVVANFFLFSNSKWNTLRLHSEHIELIYKIFSDVRTQTTFTELVVENIDKDGLFRLHLLENLTSFPNITLNITMDDYVCTSMSMTQKTTKYKPFGLKSARILRIKAERFIFPELLCKIVFELNQCKQLNTFHLECQNVTSSYDQDSTFGATLKNMLQNKVLNIQDVQLLFKGTMFITEEILQNLSEGLSSNTSIKTLSIGYLSPDLSKALFYLLGKKIDKIKICLLHVHLSPAHYNKLFFPSFKIGLKESKVMKSQSLHQVIFHCGQEQEKIRVCAMIKSHSTNFPPIVQDLESAKKPICMKKSLTVPTISLPPIKTPVARSDQHFQTRSKTPAATKQTGHDHEQYPRPRSYSEHRHKQLSDKMLSEHRRTTLPNIFSPDNK